MMVDAYWYVGVQWYSGGCTMVQWWMHKTILISLYTFTYQIIEYSFPQYPLSGGRERALVGPLFQQILWLILECPSKLNVRVW